MERIVLFDGICNFCDKSVQFIIKRDPNGYFKFASLESEVGQKLLKEHHINQVLDSIVLIEGNRYYTKSTAALNICKRLNGPWKICTIFKIIPPPIRDSFYNMIAKNRYKWFGKKDSCSIPTPEMRKRFIQ